MTHKEIELLKLVLRSLLRELKKLDSGQGDKEELFSASLYIVNELIDNFMPDYSR